jgi:hypothetical protein
MSLVAILVLALALAVVWRLVRFTARLLLLGSLIALIASYGTHATSHYAPRAPTRTAPARPGHRVSEEPLAPRRRHRSRVTIKPGEKERQ